MRLGDQALISIARLTVFDEQEGLVDSVMESLGTGFGALYYPGLASALWNVAYCNYSAADREVESVAAKAMRECGETTSVIAVAAARVWLRERNREDAERLLSRHIARRQGRTGRLQEPD